MHLKYEFVQVANDLTCHGVRQLLQEEYDFAYAPLMPGGQRLFREVGGGRAVTPSHYFALECKRYGTDLSS